MANKGRAIYRKFGESLEKLVQGNVPPGTQPNRAVAVRSLAKILGCDPSACHAWFGGKISPGEKVLTEERFLLILMHYLGKPGLESVRELRGLAALGRPEYSAILNNRDDPRRGKLWQAIKAKKIPYTKHNLDQKLIPRRSLQEEVARQARQCIADGGVLVLQGEPGSGKSTLLDYLWAGEMVEMDFDILVGQIVLSHEDLEVLEKHLAENGANLPGRNSLIVAEKVGDVETALAVARWARPGSLVVMEMVRKEVALSLPPWCIVLPLRPMDEVEAFDMFELILSRRPEEAEQRLLHELVASMGGNFLGVSIALGLSRAHGVEEVLAQIKDAPKGQFDPESALASALQMAYRVATDTEKEWIASLGALPRLKSYSLEIFQALWVMSAAQARDALWKLEENFRFVAQIGGSERPEWRIHDLVYAYCLATLDRQPVVAEHAKGWEKRLEIGERARRVEGEIREAAVRGKLKGLVKGRNNIRTELFGSPTRNLMRGAMRTFLNPAEQTNWREIQKYLHNFGAQEYLDALALTERELRSSRRFSVGVVVLLSVSVLLLLLMFVLRDYFGHNDAIGIFVVQTLFTIGWAAWAIREWLDDARAEVFWQKIWQRALTKE